MSLSRRALGALAALAAVALAAPAAQAAPPSNDNFANAAQITGLPVFDLNDLREATREAGEPQHAENATGQTVWFRYTPSQNEVVSLSTCSTRFDTVIGVYTGDAYGALTPVANDDDSCNNLGSRVAFPAQAGTTYRIAVGSFEPLTEGSGRFHLVGARVARPSNDGFRSPVRLNLRQRAIVNTELAGRQSGEPRHHGPNAATRSIWFTYRATSTRRVRLNTLASNFDTIAAVYSGSRITRLSRIASNDDAPGETFASRLSFRAIRGRTYRIAIDGYQGAAGDAVVQLTR